MALSVGLALSGVLPARAIIRVSSSFGSGPPRALARPAVGPSRHAVQSARPVPAPDRVGVSQAPVRSRPIPGASIVAAPAVPVAGPPGAKFSPALAWSVSEGLPVAARVRALTSLGETILINGKAAKAFDGRRQGDGFIEETLVHPDDGNVLVRVFHSPSSMAGLERKLDKLQALAPLAEAGAAPRIIEHGEAVVPGKGRVYFLTQERVEGRRLGQVELAASQGAVAELFDRLERAGLALAVPGPDPAWLLSRIMIGSTPSAGQRAYLLEGELEAKPREALAAHYAMLGSILKP